MSGNTPNIAWYNNATFPVTQVQKNSFYSSTDASSYSVSFGSAPVCGNALILCIVSDTTVLQVPGWNLAASAVDNTGTYIYYRTATVSESTTVTVRVNGVFSTILYIFEYSGISKLDKTSTAVGQGGNSQINIPATATTTSANELVVALGGISNGSTAVINSWDNSISSVYAGSSTGATSVTAGVGVKIVSATGTFAANATLSSNDSGHQSGIIATFK